MVQKFQPVKYIKSNPRIPKVPRQTQKPGVPKVFAPAKRTAYKSGPGEPPKGFVIGTTSRSEWYIYWALLKVKGKAGESSWGFQIDAGGGRGTKGGAVIDFVVWDQEPRLAIRVQTERFHEATHNRTHVYDETSKRMLERIGYKVIDVWEVHFITDESGQAAISIVKDALRGIERPSPVTWRTSVARPPALTPWSP